MAFTYRDIIPSLIPNTTMKMTVRDGVDYMYRITPVEGYVLHDIAADDIELDENGNPTGGINGYTFSSGTCSCSVRDTLETTTLSVPVLDGNGNIINELVTAYGTRKFFAIEISKVPDPVNQIYGIGNDHEIM